MADDTTWLTERLERTETLIIATEAAIEALVGGAQEYIYDSGQNRVRVTKAELEQLTQQLKMLEERREKIRGQLGLGSSTGRQVNVIPGF